MKSRATGQGAALPLVAILLVALWLAALLPRHLAKTDEGRYAEIPREMVETGDWLTPRLDGIKYFEKPALQYWATAAADEILGENEFSARLWTGLTGLLGLLAIGLAARRVYGRATGVAAVAVCASALLYVLMGHIATLDMGLTGFMTVTLSTILASQFAAAAEPPWLIYLAWVGAALAILSKGLIGIVLPGAVLLLYVLGSRDWRILARVRIASGSLLLLLIAAPWFVAVSQANPEFAHFFFIHEHVERFLTHEHNRVGPWWYFFPVLAAGVLPWLTLLPQALALPLRRAGALDPAQAKAHMADRFLLLWAVFIFVFFSASGSKLPSYILPVLPALALLIARVLRLASLANLGAHARAIAALALCGVATGFYLPHSASYADEVAAYTTFGRVFSAGCLMLVFGAILAARAFARGARQNGVLLLAGAGLCASLTGMTGYDAFDRIASAHYVAAVIDPLLKPASTLYSVEMYEQTLPFYLHRTMTLVNHRDELDFGLSQEPQRYLPNLEAFARRWLDDASPIAVMPPSTLDKLRAMHLPMTIILSDRRFVVATKP